MSTVARQLDGLWREVQAKPYRLDEAVERVRGLINVTDVGARRLLDNERCPSVQFEEQR